MRASRRQCVQNIDPRLALVPLNRAPDIAVEHASFFYQSYSKCGLGLSNQQVVVPSFLELPRNRILHHHFEGMHVKITRRRHHNFMAEENSRSMRYCSTVFLLLRACSQLMSVLDQ